MRHRLRRGLGGVVSSRAASAVALVLSSALVATTLVAVTQAAADAVTPGRNGRIFYIDYDNPNSIWSMRPDGSDHVEIMTNLLGAESKPVVSPDGRTVVFANQLGKLYLVDADGTHLRQLTDAGGDDVYTSDVGATWNPDGTTVLFTRISRLTQQASFYTVPAAGGRARPLPGGHTGFGPTYTPDGRHIVFTVSTGVYADSTEIFSMSATGGDVRRLTRNQVEDGDPSISPDGRTVVFSRSVGSMTTGYSDDLWAMNLDGSHQRPLTREHGPVENASDETQPTYSPDGTTIVYTRWPSGDHEEIWAMNPDGSGQRLVSAGKYRHVDPSWGRVPSNCGGRSVTISGTPGADRLVGTPGPDVIDGGAGNDVIAGTQGDDVVCGGPGNDTLNGGSGGDVLLGGTGRDRLLARDGRRDRVIDCGAGRDQPAVRDAGRDPRPRSCG